MKRAECCCGSDFSPGSIVEVEIETPCFSFIKRRSDGGIDFVSPFPSPFDYGFVPGTLAGDGDPQDAIVFTGRRLRRFNRLTARVIGCVRLVDAGAIDDKLITVEEMDPQREFLCSWVRIRLVLFFKAYVFFKKILNQLRGKSGVTRIVSVEIY